VRFDRETWGARLQRFSDRADRLHLAATFVVLAGLFGGGAALLFGLGWIAGAVTGALAAAIGLTILWLRARRTGTKVFSDDWFSS
jgi:uncharacterized membrane protein YjjP (DUF1212 family)